MVESTSQDAGKQSQESTDQMKQAASAGANESEKETKMINTCDESFKKMTLDQKQEPVVKETMPEESKADQGARTGTDTVSPLQNGALD